MSKRTDERIRSAVETLNGLSDPDTVALVLLTAGIKGERLDPVACPVAQYVRRAATFLVEVTVGPYDVGWYYPVLLASRGERVPLSSAVREFISTFDGGGYSDLWGSS